MKVAIIHDWLNQKVGGAENVLFEIAQMYPDADIYTLVYNPNKFDGYLKNRNIITSRMQAYPSMIRNQPQLLLPFIQKSVMSWDFSQYDMVISSSTAWVKNIRVPSNVKHICYCHSPARMLWDSWPKYLDRFKLGPIRSYYVRRLCSKLRLWDYYQSQQDVVFVANSDYVAKRIKKFYKRPSRVVYPPVEVESLTPSTPISKDDYYLVLSVIAPYKNIELAVQTFIKSGKRLIVAGDGSDLERLKSLASQSNNIEFVGRVSDSQKKTLLQKARGFIFCSIEDFGITMVESIASNTPVIALRGGGASEIIHEGKTGMFFEVPTEAALYKTIDKFEVDFKNKVKLPNKYVFEKFSTTVFKNKLKEITE